MDAESLSNDIYAKVEALRSQAEEAFGRLESAAALPYLSWFNFSSSPAFEPKRVPSVSSSGFPVLEKIELQAGADLTLDMMEGYKTKVWISPELERLETLMLQYIETGGTGIGQDVEDAIFNRGRERALQNLRDKMDLAGARTGARGFRYPNSMTKAAQKAALTEYGDEKADLNREIIRLVADLAQKNTQFAAGKAQEIERDYMDFSKAFIGVILDIKKGILDKFRVEQEARVAEFNGALQGKLAAIEVELKNAGLEQDFQGQVKSKWEIESNHLLERGRAQIAQAEHANGLRMSSMVHLANVVIGLLQNLQANVISLVTKES